MLSPENLNANNTGLESASCEERTKELLLGLGEEGVEIQESNRHAANL